MIEKFNDSTEEFMKKWGLKKIEPPQGEYDPYVTLYANDNVIVEVKTEIGGLI